MELARGIINSFNQCNDAEKVYNRGAIEIFHILQTRSSNKYAVETWHIRKVINDPQLHISFLKSVSQEV